MPFLCSCNSGHSNRKSSSSPTRCILQSLQYLVYIRVLALTNTPNHNRFENGLLGARMHGLLHNIHTTPELYTRWQALYTLQLFDLLKEHGFLHNIHTTPKLYTRWQALYTLKLFDLLKELISCFQI